MVMIIITITIIIIITIIMIMIIMKLPNNTLETRKYCVDVQQGIVSSYGERDPL